MQRAKAAAAAVAAAAIAAAIDANGNNNKVGTSSIFNDFWGSLIVLIPNALNLLICHLGNEVLAASSIYLASL